jgi:Leucine-rich repeat (LRR) protein
LSNLLSPLDWWNQLEPQWRQAFSFSVLRHNNEPTAAELNDLFNTPTVRLAGPTAPFPNCKTELTNLSGLEGLTNLAYVIITHHKIETVEILGKLPGIKSLFLFNNSITSLNGIEGLPGLEQLYVQCNQISSIKPIEKLIFLKELYIHDNIIDSLDGLTESHSDQLTRFVCRPNSLLKQKEIIRAERELGIICR